MDLETALKLDIDAGTLSRFWIVRNYLSTHTFDTDVGKELEGMLTTIAKREEIETDDPVIKSVYVLCNCEGTGCYTSWYKDTDYKDELVLYFANKFNQITGSKRKLFKCYDCGTVARAMFMKLIDDFRGFETLTGEEIEKIQNYKYNSMKLHTWYNLITEGCPSGKRLLTITSQGFGGVGHVWLMDVTGKKSTNNHKVRIFQSAKWAYTLADFIKTQCPLGDCFIDFEEFYHEIYAINNFNLKTADIIDFIAKWFKFKFKLSEFKPKRQFLYCDVVIPLDTDSN